MFIGFPMMYCFSSFINSRGINVAVRCDLGQSSVTYIFHDTWPRFLFYFLFRYSYMSQQLY